MQLMKSLPGILVLTPTVIKRFFHLIKELKRKGEHWSLFLVLDDDRPSLCVRLSRSSRRWDQNRVPFSHCRKWFPWNLVWSVALFALPQ